MLVTQNQSTLAVHRGEVTEIRREMAEIKESVKVETSEIKESVVALKALITKHFEPELN